MNTYQQIQILINAIQAESNDEALKQQKIALVNKLLETTYKYVTIVVQQGFLIQDHEGKQF